MVEPKSTEFRTMAQYRAETRDFAYFGDSDSDYIIASSHRDADILTRSQYAAKQKIIELGLRELLGADVDISEYLHVETFSHWLVGHGEWLLLSADAPDAIFAELDRYERVARDEYALPSSKVFGYVDSEEIMSELEYSEACEAAASALYELGVPSSERDAVAPYVVEWGATGTGSDDYEYAGSSDYWPSKRAQFWGYVAYRRAMAQRERDIRAQIVAAGY